MKKIVLNINIETLKSSYLELGSSYKVAEKYNISATVVKRLLKEAGVLRTQNAAAKERCKIIKPGKYIRTEAHKKNLSECAKKRTGSKNPFFGKEHSIEAKKSMSEAAKERTGKRNPNYKTGSYLRRPRDFKIAEFTRIRNFIFNRDKHTCAYCGKMGGHLHAHHKLPYWVTREAFLDLNNIITVCTECHFEKAHKGNWQKFDTEIIDKELLQTYSLDCERLNELAGNKPDAIVRPSDINKTED